MKLHEAVVIFARQASVEKESLKKFILENKALRILQFLSHNIEEAGMKTGADRQVCDRLMMIYTACSVHLSGGNDQEAIDLMNGLIRKQTINGRKAGVL